MVISGITPHSIELTSRRFYQTGRKIYQDNFRLFADAKPAEYFSKHLIRSDFVGDRAQGGQGSAEVFGQQVRGEATVEAV